MRPLKFKALLKQTLWGGDKIIPFKHLTDNLENVGESWEISGVKGNETPVTEGEFAGRSLNDVVTTMKEKLVGKANYERFGDEKDGDPDRREERTRLSVRRRDVVGRGGP